MAILENANEILEDADGNVAYLTDDELYIYDATDVTQTAGYIKHAETDLGEPSLDKHVNYLDIDYKGIFLIYVYMDGVAEYTYILPFSADRTRQWIYLPLDARKPVKRVYLHYYTITADSVIYGTEIDFNVVQRRKEGDG